MTWTWLWHPLQRLANFSKPGKVPKKMVGFLASPSFPELSGTLRWYMHWSKITVVQLWSWISFCIPGIFQANEVNGFSSVKNEPCSASKWHKWSVRWSISLPWISLLKLPIPKGLSLVLVPLFRFCSKLNEPHGKAKCQICLGREASLAQLSKNHLENPNTYFGRRFS